MSKKTEKKAKKAAKKPEEMKNLPWSDEMVVALLTVVYDTKAHLQSHNKNVGIYWHKVAIKFFDQPDCILFKENHLVIDPTTQQADYRKIRDKYHKVLEAVQLDIEKGNQSGKEGDLSPLYKLVKMINDEIDAQDVEKAAVKENAASDKTQLAANESTVLGTIGKKRNANTAIRVRAADGTITVDAERERKQQNKTMNGLDEVMIKMLQEKFNSSSSESSSSAPVQQSRAEKVLNLLSSFVESNYFTTESFLCLAYRVTNAPPPEELVLELQLIGGLEMLLSLYCSKEDNFSATSFCQHMQQLEINAKPARIMHLQLEKWRKHVETPVPTSLSVSSSRSSADISALTSLDRSNDTTPPFDNNIRIITHNLSSSENAIGSFADHSSTINLHVLQQEIDTALCSTILDDFDLPQTSSSSFV